MEYTLEDLAKKRLVELRAIAKESDHQALRGYSTMHKAQLLRALCEALGIQAHAHHEALGIDKHAIKGKIRELKVQRDAALQAHDRAELKRLRRKIHRLKRKIRASTL